METHNNTPHTIDVSGLPPEAAQAVESLVDLLRRNASVPAAEATIDRPAWKRVLEIMDKVPDEDFKRVPTDSSAQLDHYVYGTPKQPGS